MEKMSIIYVMKKFVDVVTQMRADGTLVPLELVWDDGVRYKIDKVLDVRPCASLKGGGFGVRYQVLFSGQIRNLYLDEYKWFVEVD